MTDATGASPGAPVEPTMADLRIKDGVGFATIGERTIVLDVNADRYWQVGEADGEAMRLIAAGAAPTHARAIERLRKFGFIEDGRERSVGRLKLVDRASPAAATASALESGHAIMGAGGSILDVGSSVLGAFMKVRFRPLRRNLEALVRARMRDQEPGAHADLCGIAQAFAGCRRLIPVKPACLPDTLAFLDWAARLGCYPRIVFGVQATPFRAHCWAQSGDLVLTDPLDRTRAFVPLLSI